MGECTGRRRSHSWLTLALLAATACGGGARSDRGTSGSDGAGCSDEDGDGYGVGAECVGPDCNDQVVDVHTEEQCARLCREHADRAPGCPCEVREPEVCYLGPPDSEGRGVCKRGIMTCEDGVWGACAGQVLPSEETCDDADDDCDGVVDDGVLSACGNCDPTCREQCFGVGCPQGFDVVGSARGLVATPEGGVTLEGHIGVENYVIWIANSQEGTVAKIDTRARVERGRYRTGPNSSTDPSRTTVDHRGDVVVANRAGGLASKFYASDCPDVDGNGTVETSTGLFDVYPWTEDECLAWSTSVGEGARGSAFERRVGLDGVLEEMVWVGDWQHFDAHEIDSTTGEPTGRILPEVTPYGIAMGPDNALWTFEGVNAPVNAPIVRVFTTDEVLEKEVFPLPEGEARYGIAVDSAGRVWIGGTVARYDPDLDEWESPPALVSGGGIACDAYGNAYVGEFGDAWKIDGETLVPTRMIGVGGHGWAIDFDGYVWSVEFLGRSAWVSDPETLEPVGSVHDLVEAYTYSDMTGFQLANVRDPLGVQGILFEGCADGDKVWWAELEWDAQVPAGTALRFSARTADDPASLQTARRINLGSAPPTAPPVSIAAALVALGEPPRSLLYVEVELVSIDRVSAPILKSVTVRNSCGEVIR